MHSKAYLIQTYYYLLSIVHVVIMLEINLILKMHSSLTDMAILFYIHQTIDLIS